MLANRRRVVSDQFHGDRLRRPSLFKQSDGSVAERMKSHIVAPASARPISPIWKIGIESNVSNQACLLQNARRKTGWLRRRVSSVGRFSWIAPANIGAAVESLLSCRLYPAQV
jgi:hypothetical protein